MGRAREQEESILRRLRDQDAAILGQAQRHEMDYVGALAKIEEQRATANLASRTQYDASMQAFIMRMRQFDLQETHHEATLNRQEMSLEAMLNKEALAQQLETSKAFHDLHLKQIEAQAAAAREQLKAMDVSAQQGRSSEHGVATSPPHQPAPAEEIRLD
jgi:hypothetical protein